MYAEAANNSFPSASTRFEVGTVYSCRSVCDSNCVWIFVVQSRTAKQVILVDASMNEVRRGISEYQGVETCFPLGKYSMAPILRAA